MNAIVQKRITKYGSELWGDLSKTNPEFLAMVDYVNSGERGMKTTCPHCGTAALVRSSKQMSKLVRHATCSCLNVVCGHTFIVAVEAIRTISPPSFPDPEVSSQLKQSDRWIGLRGAGKGQETENLAEGAAMT